MRVAPSPAHFAPPPPCSAPRTGFSTRPRAASPSANLCASVAGHLSPPQRLTHLLGWEATLLDGMLVNPMMHMVSPSSVRAFAPIRWQISYQP